MRSRQGVEAQWTPIYQALNLPLINEFAWGFAWEKGWEGVGDRIAEYLALAGLPERTIPLAAERAIARQQGLIHEQQKREEEARTALERWREEQATAQQRQQTEKPKWGTAAAKRLEVERLRLAIEARKKR